MLNKVKWYELVLPCAENKFSPHLTRKKHWFRLAVFLLALKVLLATGLYWAVPEQAYLSEISANKIIELTNQERLAADLNALSANPLLTEAAYAKAQDMLTENYWAHVSPSGKEPWDFIKASGYQWLVAGENLAKGFQTSEKVLTAWVQSTAHKQNLLNPAYTEIGVATVVGKLQGQETILVVQMFGKPLENKTTSLTTTTQALQVKTSSTQLVPPQSQAVPGGGNFLDSVSVNLVTQDPQATIYYSLGAGLPSTSSSRYSQPIVINSSKLLRFFAVSASGVREEIQTEKYLITKGKPKQILISNPPAGSFVAKPETVIRGQAFQITTVTLNLNQTAVATVQTADDLEHSFSFVLPLADGEYAAQVRSAAQQSEITNFTVDTLAPIIDPASLAVRAQTSANKAEYTISVKVSGTPSLVKLFCADKQALFSKGPKNVFAAIISLPKSENTQTCSIYTEDMARNTSTLSFNLSGQVGETLGVNDTNQQLGSVPALAVSNTLQDTIRYLSLGLTLLISCALILKAYSSYRRGAQAEGRHTALHALLTFCLLIVLMLT